MRRLLIVAVVLTVLSVLIAGPALAQQQEREEITVLIPLKFMSAATAAQLFGGTVISPMPTYGQNAFGARNMGSRHGRSSYSSVNRGGNSGWGAYQSGQNVGGYGVRGIDLGQSYWR